MTPIRGALAMLVLLGALLAATLEIDTDVRGLLGGDTGLTAAIDTSEGRSLTLAVIDPDIEKRSMLAVEIAAAMTGHPMVRRVTTAPEPPGADMIDWIWQHRFVLAPPGEEVFTVAMLTDEMRRARAALISASDAVLAGPYLRDPTGSFRRIVEALSAGSGGALPVHRAIPQARDNSAALIFIETVDRPFNVAEQQALSGELRQRVEAGGAQALLVGPRAISAVISDRIAVQTNRAALTACALLLLWLGFILRPAAAILNCLLPPALGFLGAALVVQVVFGSVHVIAFGFGGALMGLAVDYPIHLMAHRNEVARARRLVGLGVATTAIAFAALLGSGIPAIQQVGLFVATGLSVAALSTIWLVDSPGVVRLRTFLPVKRPLVQRHKPSVLAVVVLIFAGLFWQMPVQTSQRVVGVPPDIIEQIKRLNQMIDLPSARYRIEVTGATLSEVLDRQARLGPVLTAAKGDGLISRAAMLGGFLPHRPSQNILPAPDEFSAAVALALPKAGLNPEFLETVVAEYRAAQDVEPVTASTFPQFDEMSGISGLIRDEGEQLKAQVLLWRPTEVETLAARVAGLGDGDGNGGVRFVDQERSVAAGLAALSKRVSIWFAAGAVAAVLFLGLAVRRSGDVIEIVLSCAAAGLLTMLIAGTLGGGIGVFHIVALTLVVGIGIDYGIFLTLSEDQKQYQEALRSVLLCAVTTLIAFLTMALSGVTVLEEIGLTISIGVIAMVGVNLARRRIARSAEET